MSNLFPRLPVSPRVRAVSTPRVSRRVLLGAAAATALAGCAEQPDYPAGPLRIASGGVGGVYYAYAQGIEAVVRSSLPRLRPAVLSTAASVENLRLVSAGRAEIGFAAADAASDGYLGRPPFTEALPVLALGRIYEDYLHLVVRRDRGITGVTDLRGHRISVGAPGSGTELFANRLLPVAGLNMTTDLHAERLNPGVAADAVRSGRLDGMLFSGGIPTAAIASLANSVAITLLELGSFVRQLRERYGEVYVERTIPASAYGLGTPTVTVGIANYLVVLRTMVEPVAYRVTRALFERRDLLAAAHPVGSRLDRGAAISTEPLPLHPGAIRYYREAKH
jgi:TRAP transporter TAXI family solute receptor